MRGCGECEWLVGGGVRVSGCVGVVVGWWELWWGRVCVWVGGGVGGCCVAGEGVLLLCLSLIEYTTGSSHIFLIGCS